MAGSEDTDIQKVVFKTEPVDNYEQENYYNAQTLTYQSSLRKSSGKNGIVSQVAGKSKTQEDDIEKVDSFSEIVEKVQHIKRSNSISEDSNTILDSSSKEFPIVEDIKESDCALPSCRSDFPDSNLEKCVDQKPSSEELEVYSRGLSKLNTSYPLCGSESHSQLTHCSAYNNNVRTGGSQDENLVTPYEALSSRSHSQLLHTSHRRYTTRLLSKKEGTLSGKKFIDSEIMKTVVSRDGTITFFQCESCSKVFNRRQTLRQHFITHTDRFACHYCQTRCKSKGDLDRHIQTHTKEKPYHCYVCNTDYTRDSILRKHMKTQRHLRASYGHEDILHLYKKDQDVDNFVITQTKQTLDFTCDKCHKVTFSKAEYRKHARSHAFKYICSICQKGCKSSLLLKIHSRSHNKVTSLSCKVCSRSFSNFYCLKEHIKSHRPGSSNKVTKKTFVKAAKIKDTAKMKLQSVSGRTQTTDKGVNNIPEIVTKFECDECKLIFSSKRYLANHSCAHDETYVCGICTKTFSNLSKLKIHLKFHERILKCDVCDMKFYDDNELKDHVQKLHIVNHEYTCRLCYSHFERASDLESHMHDHVPTMLFSGRSLDESKMPVVNKTRIKPPSGSNTGLTKDRKSETSSKNEEVKVLKSEFVEASKCSDSDDDSLLESPTFYEILNTALDGSDDNLNDTEISDSDEEIYSGIKKVIESELMTSSESDDNAVLKKPLFYGHEDIMKEHCAEFERGSETDLDSQIFKCKLCDIIFHEDKYLKNHLKQHVCEHCNIFFKDKENLAAHKSRHVKQLLKYIKTEARRLSIPKQKWKGYLMISSESEQESGEQNLNEVEDDEPQQAGSIMSFLHTLSHDEIIEANKHIFDQYSRLEPSNNIFACTICKRKYARPTTLTRHFKTHVCQFCNKFFKDKSDLREHKYSHRKAAALIKAEITGEDSKIPSPSLVSKPNRKLFKKYSFINADRNIFRCTLCNKGFVRSTVLTRHLKTHICGHCDKFFEDKFDLVRHVTFQHVKNQLIESDDADDDDDEFTENDEGEKYISPSTSVSENIDHEQHNITLLPSYSLPHINPTFQTEPSFNNKNETITVIRIPIKDSSDTVNAKLINLPESSTSSFQIISQPVQVYKNIAQDSESVASTSCEDSKSMIMIPVSQSEMLYNMTEERDRPFECGECGKKFLKNDHLRSHMTIHTGDRPFICSLCCKTFGRITILKKHMKTHMKQCKICDATFSHKYELDLHKDVHRKSTFHQ